MKKILMSLAVSAALLPAMAAAGYDATAEYSTAGNPNGVWSYGYSSSAGAGYSLISFDAISGTAWQKSGYVSLGTPSIWKNTGASAYGVDPGQISLHPGPLASGDVAILRFTAPSAAGYNVSAQFFDGDGGNMSAAIVVNGSALSPLASFASTNAEPTYAGLVTLAVGGTIDFVVGNNGNYLFGNTPVSAVINAVPEPETYGMMLAGLGVLGAVIRRRKQQS